MAILGMIVKRPRFLSKHSQSGGPYHRPGESDENFSAVLPSNIASFLAGASSECFQSIIMNKGTYWKWNTLKGSLEVSDDTHMYV